MVAAGAAGAADESDLVKAYGVLNEMTGLIARAQADGRIRGFKIAKGGQQRETLGGYELSIGGLFDLRGLFGPGTGGTTEPRATGYALAIQSADDEFIVVGRGITITFTASNAQVEVDSAQEGRYANGRWIPGRTLNGDERYFLFPQDALRVVRLKLLRR
jgi:hypothetical protein